MNFGIAPGLNTNGMDPKNYSNDISLNLISGYSMRNNVLEISGISSFHTHSSTGYMLSGVVNIVGGNRRDLKRYTRNELSDLTSDFRGIQFTGILNLVSGGALGGQLSGGGNLLLNGNLAGVQCATAFNYVNGNADGIQLALLFNGTRRYFSGIQLSGLINNAGTEMYGFQIGSLNVCRTMYGPRSGTNITAGTQVGVVNISKTTMDGFQIGLINKGGDSKGFQFGLINFFRKGEGYPVGLFNIGQGRTGVKVWADNVAALNAHILTGSRHISNTFVVGTELASGKRNPFLLGYSIGHTRFLNRNIFNHFELMVRSMAVNFKSLQFNPIYTAAGSFSFHMRKRIFISVGAGLNYDPDDYFKSKKLFFPALSLGLASLG